GAHPGQVHRGDRYGGRCRPGLVEPTRDDAGTARGEGTGGHGDQDALAASGEGTGGAVPGGAVLQAQSRQPEGAQGSVLHKESPLFWSSTGTAPGTAARSADQLGCVA